MLIVLSPLFVQLMHTNHYKIVKQLKSFKITIVAPTCFGLHKSSLRIFFNVLLTVHFSIFILVINQLYAQRFCFTTSIYRSLYMFRAYVLIIRRSKLHYTASGINTPIGGRARSM